MLHSTTSLEVKWNKCVLIDNNMKAKKNPCWEGYQMIGTKMKGNKKVPNCVPKKKYSMGGVVSSKKKCTC